MGLYTSKSNKTKSQWSYTQGQQELDQEIEKLLSKAKEKGLEEEPDLENKPSLLNRLFGVLSTGETAPLVHELLRTGSLEKAVKKQGQASGQRITGKGIGDHKTYEDVLADNFGLQRNIGTKVAGVGLDILLDPTTYIGAGLIGKAGKGLQKTAGKAGKIISKVPAGAKAVDKVTDVAKGVEKAFSPTARVAVEGLSKSEAEKYLDDIFGASVKGGRYQEDLLKKLVEEKAGAVAKEFGDDAGVQISRAIESGADVGKMKEVKEFFEESFKQILKDEKAAGLATSELDDYVPHLLTSEAREFAGKSDSLGQFLSQKLPFAKQRGLEGNIVDINKDFHKFLKGQGLEPFDLFEEDVFKLLGTRQKSSIKAIRMRNLLDDVSNNFGISHKDMLSKVSEDGKKFLKDAYYVDGVKYVPLPESKIRFFPGVDQSGNKVMSVAKNQRSWIPEGIANHLLETNRFLIGDESTQAFVKTYDKVLNAWKKSVTGYFPAFHGRNMLGGMFNNWLGGVKNPQRYLEAEKLARASDDVVKFDKWSGTYKELLEEMNKRGVLGSQGYIDIFGGVDEAVTGAVDTSKKGLAKKALKKADDAPLKLMNEIETRLRGTLLLDRLAKGDDLGQASKEVFKYHFDYAPEAFTPFERNVMRRIIPFYTWTRRNVPLQLAEMYRQPQKFASLGKISRTARGDAEDADVLPEYMTEGFLARIGGTDEKPEFLYSLGLPVEDINKLNKTDILSLISPLVKVPAELVTNRHFFFNKPLDEVDRPAKGFEKAPEVIKKAVGYNESTGKVDPVKWHIFTSLFGRFVWTASNVANDDSSATAQALYTLLGIKAKPVDLEQQKYYKTKENRDKVGEFLKKKGVGAEFNTYYVPK